MKKVMIALLLILFLGGCKTTPETVVEYKPIYPPESLTVECYPAKPDRVSVRGTIEIQKRAIDQCNDQLSNLREWRKLNTEKEGEQ